MSCSFLTALNHRKCLFLGQDLIHENMALEGFGFMRTSWFILATFCSAPIFLVHQTVLGAYLP